MNDTPKITAAIHSKGSTWYVVDNHTSSDANVYVDKRAAQSGQRIIRHDDGSCTIEDLPHVRTALEVVEHWLWGNQGREHDERIEVDDIRNLLAELRNAILAGRHGGPT